MYIVKFMVVMNNLSNLLSFTTLREMNLMSTNDNVVKKYQRVFNTDELGQMPGRVHLQIQPDSKPQILPPDESHVRHKMLLKLNLIDWVKLGVLTPVSKPTTWVNQMADIMAICNSVSTQKN